MSTVATEPIKAKDIHCPHCGGALTAGDGTRRVNSVRTERSYRCEGCGRRFMVAKESRIIYVRLKWDGEDGVR